MKLGILGGMGPMATVRFYEMIVKNTDANCDQEHIDTVIISHATMPDRTKAILDGEVDELLEKTRRDIQVFERLACEYIAIPCNTMHYFYKDIQEMTEIKVLNMIEIAVDEAFRRFGNSKIAVLGTDGTMKTRIYENEIKKRNLEYLRVNKSEQELIMETIYGIKSTGNLYYPDFEKLIYNLLDKKSVDCIILACTELSIAEFKNIESHKIVNAMKELSLKAVKLIKT
ncbi:MAG: amino acid racemase [Tissierellia bacterium]|nr:amino acid racemase [Tissierellia bacterium]